MLPVSAHEAPPSSSPADAPLRRPEVLAPAGNEEMMKAAVENGADAVYFGLQSFNARLRAANFRVEDLPRLMAGLHERGVRGYITMNTLIFTEELEEAAAVLRACSDAGVDAILVQDLGLARLANRVAPGLPVHASTQMTITCAESIAALEAFGLRLERVVVARELSRKELRKITAATRMEVETFVHGAICVAYSGQCLTSEALGGRSANRGECAQACRLPYDLVVDGETQDLGDVKYLLSPKDLAAYEDIGDLIRMGIASLKIEGRLKSPHYVAATVQSYRAAVDQTFREGNPHLEEETRRQLEMTFSRGFTGGYLHETNHQAVVEGRFPKKRGLLVGEVLRVAGQRVVIRATGPIKRGDGIVFDAGRPAEDEEGGRVYEMRHRGADLPAYDPLDATTEPGAELSLGFATNALDVRRIAAGMRVWKTSDPELDARLAATWDGEKLRFHRPVHGIVEGAAGMPLRLTFRDEDGVEGSVTDTAPAEPALKRPLTAEYLREQLGRLGNTPFSLAGLEVRLDGALMVPVSRLNDLRRRAAEDLLQRRRARGTERPAAATTLADLRSAVPTDRTPLPSTEIAVLCRTLEQVRAVVDLGIAHTIYTDFEDIRLHREARLLVPGTPQAPRFVPATLRIVKPGEGTFVRKLLEAQPDALLVRNAASWQILREAAPGLELRGDYPLNVSNELTADLLMAQGFRWLTPSYDLNIDQLALLLAATPPHWWEVTVHQYMPMFHMEHCVFCRFLSTGTDYTNCGRPCETHKLALRDRVGYEHPVKADAGCRNTVFNAVAQSASAYLGRIRAAGVRRFRIDLLTEDAAAAANVVRSYAPALRGEEDGGELWRALRAHSKLGVTRGSLDHE